MTKLEELEKSVAALPKAELDQFAVWFDELRATQWATRMELNVDNAALNALADDALRDHRAGQTTTL